MRTGGSRRADEEWSLPVNGNGAFVDVNERVHKPLGRMVPTRAAGVRQAVVGRLQIRFSAALLGNRDNLLKPTLRTRDGIA